MVPMYFQLGKMGRPLGHPRALALNLSCHEHQIAFWESNHINVGEHAVFDGDGCDVTCIVCVDEEDAALVPEGFAVSFAGFNV
jgi:hypothetical protein